MGISDWFSRKTPLQLALRRGVENGKLQEALRELGDVIVRSRQDADAICAVLEGFLRGEVRSADPLNSPLRAVAGLFQEVDGGDCDAFPLLRTRGTPLLRAAVERAVSTGEEQQTNEVLFLLKILAMYGTREGAQVITRLAGQGFRAGDWLWSVVLGGFREGHPEARFVFSTLSDPLPQDFIAIALLDAANRFFLEGGEARHPFDSEEGVTLLRTWLEDPDEEHYSYANSAVAAVPFIEHPARMELLEKATRHPSADVRVEGAWAAAKLGAESGFQSLALMCLDANLSSRACEYLRELKREDVIPAEASEPEFVARAEFAQWLAHPNELGHPPEKLEVHDHRTLRWPIDFGERPVWLFRYVVSDRNGMEPDDVGVGMVGSITWCFFSYNLEQRPPEDCYALHCFWEMERGWIVTHDIAAGEREYDAMLAAWKGSALGGVRLEHVAELESALRHPRKLVAVARAEQEGRAGWVILDGADSRWYPADHFPPEETGQTILKIHVGRCILGLPLDAERKSWLRPKEVVPDDRIIATYGKMLIGVSTLAAKEQVALLSDYGSPLAKHFERYVDAVANVRQSRRAEVVATTYEAILASATSTVALPPEKALDSFTPVGKHFENYVAALLELGRGADVLALVRKLTPLWQHNLGYGKLGAAAFQAGDDTLAEELLLKMKGGGNHWTRSEEMTHLAEIWHRRGEHAAARNLMVECLRGTLADSTEATGTDIEFHERIYQRQRQDFARIFGSADTLETLGLPQSTIAQ